MANLRIAKKRKRMMEKKAQKNQKNEKIVIMNLPVQEVQPVSAEDQKTGKVKVKNMKSRFFVQYQGHEFENQDIVAKIKQKWKEEGNMVKDIKELDIYLKPEEAKAYYTINGEISGSVAAF